MTSKGKPQVKRSAAAQKPVSTGGKAASARLEAENLALKKQLAAAEVRIALLERQRDEALNRIEWVIDSINSLGASVR
jgi:hypothetical protein